MTTPITQQYCYKHTSVETGLRCNRCDRPICSRCAIHTETGYRCPECIRGQQRVFDTAHWYDFPLALMVAAGLSFLGSLLSNLLGFWVIFLSPFAGMLIAEAVRFVIHNRRNRNLYKLVGVATFLGGMIVAIPPLIAIIINLSAEETGFSMVGFGLLSLAWPAIYSIITAVTCFRRLSGIQLR